MAIVGSLATIEQQLVPSPRFELALGYLRQALDPASAVHQRIATLPAGAMERVEIGEGVFALEQAYLGKAAAEGRFEAHDQHIDLQAMITADELMEVTPREGLSETENLLAEKDVVFLGNRDRVSRLVVRPGEIAVFFPADAHKPSLAVAEPVLARKTCVKVRL